MRPSINTWCAPCRANVVMLTPDEAAALAQRSTRDIYSRVATGELHSIKTDDGALRVCVRSLSGTNIGE